MILAADQRTFDDLYPFSFMTGNDGRITTIGRSLQKIYPKLHSSKFFLEAFALSQPESRLGVISPGDLVGDVVVLASLIDLQTKLRGQVVRCSDTSEGFIFSLEPCITSLSDISRLGLTITDFKVGDPIFDFLLYMQGQIINQTKLRAAKITLEWESRVSNLLLEIALESEEGTTEQEVYQKVISSVCKKLQWEVGHVFIASERCPDLFVSANVWEVTDRERFRDLYRATRDLQTSYGESLPGRVRSQRQVVWAHELQNSTSFVRRHALQGFTHLTGVGVPILVDNEVTAVMEFFTESIIDNVENMTRFFNLLSLQLSSVIARQRAEAEAQRQVANLAQASKMATLGEIAAGVAHEINNPLHTLTLTSTLLRRLLASDRLTNDLLVSQLDQADSCVDRMAIIVSELKAFSRDSSTDAFESTSLKKVVDETLDLCLARFAANAVSVSAGDIPEGWKAECRSSQISQVLLNLLNNAYDAVIDQPERWIKIDVFDKNTAFEIAVTDSGPSIPPSIAEKIMAPFFTTKPPGKGTGLGLSISSNIMTDHGGSLTVDGTSPHTRFVISLPKKHYEQKLPAIEAQATETEHHDSFHVSANHHPRSHEDTPAGSI